MKSLHTMALASALTLGLAGAAAAADITVLVPTGPDGAGLRSAAADYEAATGESVEVVQVPFLNVFEKAATSCSSRSGSFDILLIDDPWFQFLADNDCLEPMGDYFRAMGTDGPDNDCPGATAALPAPAAFSTAGSWPVTRRTPGLAVPCRPTTPAGRAVPASTTSFSMPALVGACAARTSTPSASPRTTTHTGSRWISKRGPLTPSDGTKPLLFQRPTRWPTAKDAQDPQTRIIVNALLRA